MNKRLDFINEFVNKNITNDAIKNILNLYKNELDSYNYIETIDKFSTLTLRGSLKYVNKYDNLLRDGGLLVKIINNRQGDEYFAIIKKPNNKKYYIKFNNNYFFYKETKYILFKKSLIELISNNN